MTELRDIGPNTPVPHQPKLHDSYSVFVTMAKRALPLTALLLLVLVALWPRLDLGIGRFTAFPKLDPRQAHDLRMLKAHYTGIDRDNRPYVVTADAAEQMSNDVNDMIGLEGPKGDLTSVDGRWYEVSSYTGTYLPQSHMLNLFGNVALFSDRGDEFHTDSAKVNLADSSAESDEPVTGQGPFGTVKSAGFRVTDHGATIFFTGHTDLMLAPRQEKSAAEKAAK